MTCISCYKKLPSCGRGSGAGRLSAGSACAAELWPLPSSSALGRCVDSRPSHRRASVSRSVLVCISLVANDVDRFLMG